ncbi:DUF4126 family protein [Hymenobacter sp. B81]|uniref:DUF4126 family protein n=1 Tax=Hymenobacter sp. B81 TaxID=3344878 RepID=UPI0037DC662A
MRLIRSTVFWQAVGLGFLAGMRSMSALAFVSHHLRHRPAGGFTQAPLRWLQTPLVAHGLKLLAGAEMLGDKLPAMPARTAPVSVAGRTLSGALAGAVLYKLNRQKLLRGALVGGTAAAAGTFAAFHLRRLADQQTDLQEPWTGFVEDALVFSGGKLLLGRS